MAEIIYREGWPNRGMPEVAVVWKENVLCRDHPESMFLMVKYKSLIAVCGFTTKLSLFVSLFSGSRVVSAASVGLSASHRVPQKNKWVSCLSIVRYWVSGQECGQCAKVAGRGECSLVFLTWWDGLWGGGRTRFSQGVQNMLMKLFYIGACCHVCFKHFIHIVNEHLFTIPSLDYVWGTFCFSSQIVQHKVYPQAMKVGEEEEENGGGEGTVVKNRHLFCFSSITTT